MKNTIILVFIFLSSLANCQTSTENYIKTKCYSEGYSGSYSNYSTTLNTTDIINPGTGGASGSVNITNNNLSINFTGSLGSNAKLRNGIVKSLNIYPVIENLFLGPILTSSGSNTGYFAKITTNNLTFYSPYFLNGFNCNLSKTIVDTTINYSQNISSLYNCSGTSSSGGSSGLILINNGMINLNASGGWASNCNLKLGQIHFINIPTTLPNIELGFLNDNNGNQTIYKAKIESNWLIFYASEAIPSLPTNANLNFSSSLLPNSSNIKEYINYYDSLGRNKQSIVLKAGSNLENIITPFEYDNQANQSKSYLPFADFGSPNGEIYLNAILGTNSVSQFYNQNKYEFTLNPYTENLYENSPQNKILETFSPGNDWSSQITSNSRSVKYENKTNIFNEVRKFKTIPDGSIVNSQSLEIDGFYEANELYKTVIKNENWVSTDGLNNTTQKFTDKDGKVILERAFNHDDINNLDLVYNQYNVYDDLGRLSFVISPKGSDIIDSTVGNTTIANRSYPWTIITEFNGNLANEYNNLFYEYEDEEILNIDLNKKYGGQGNINVSSNNNELIVNISINTLEPIELKKGIILSLKEFGNFKDIELGRIKSNNYDYFFLIKDNSLVIDGKGKLSSINANLVGNSKLSYNFNYSWAELVEIDSKEADNYLTELKEIDSNSILSSNIPNQYGAMGGINMIVDNNDNIYINLNISATSPLKFKKGIVVPLKTERRIADVNLGFIEDNGFKYKFAIKENNLYIDGSGGFLNIAYADVFNSTTSEIPQDAIEGLCYQYRYDARNRLVEKRIPGKDWEYYVYDKFDRVVLYQDSGSRILNNWLFTKYDVFNRIIYTGKFEYISAMGNSDSFLRIELQNIIDNNIVCSETKSTTTFLNGGININYTNSIFPNNTSTNYQVLTVNYYDNYNFNPFSLPISIPTTIYNGTYPNNTVLSNLKTFSTATLVRVLNTNDWIFNLLAYDNKGRLIWSKSTNSYLQSSAINEIQLDFLSKPIETKKTITKSGSVSDLIITDKYTYDHAGRLLVHTQKINNQSEQLIKYNNYDELGKLIQKKVGGPSPLTASYPSLSSYFQKIDFKYNIRGWLTEINNPNSYLTDNFFALKLNYNNLITGVTPKYNGNITQSMWKTINDNKQRKYNFIFDKQNQLTNSVYEGNYPILSSPQEDFSENVAYDKNRNITSLQRFGLKNDNQHIDQIDNLNYFYEPNSNKLKKIDDISMEDAGFKDISIGDYDYTYDVNGNLKTDVNKNITNINYNHLNKPVTIVFNNQDITSPNPITIQFIYDALGNKLAKLSTISYPNSSGGWYPPVVEKTEYLMELIFNNNVLQFIPNSEGYSYNDGTNNFRNVFQFKDNLGNIRLSYTDLNLNDAIEINEIFDENNFYPFGLKHTGYNNIVSPLGNLFAQKFKFQGKELDETLGLNFYDFGARNYDSSIGRWFNVDNLAEATYSFSPFNFAVNNPSQFIDPDGNFSFSSTWDSFASFFTEHPVTEFVAEGTKGWGDINLNWDNEGIEFYKDIIGIGPIERFSKAVRNKDLKGMYINLMGIYFGAGGGLLGYIESRAMKSEMIYIEKLGIEAATKEAHWFISNERMRIAEAEFRAASLDMQNYKNTVQLYSSINKTTNEYTEAALSAASWQGKGSYPGVDNWRNIGLEEGKLVYGGLPGQSNFYTSFKGLSRSGYNKSNLWEGLQVQSNPVHGPRTEIGIYQVNAYTPAAFGTTYANPQFGSGGLPQIYIPDYSNLELIGIIKLR